MDMLQAGQREDSNSLLHTELKKKGTQLIMWNTINSALDSKYPTFVNPIIRSLRLHFSHLLPVTSLVHMNSALTCRPCSCGALSTLDQTITELCLTYYQMAHQI